MQKKTIFLIFKFVERPLNIFARLNPLRGLLFYQKEQNFRAKLKIKKMKVKFERKTIYFFSIFSCKMRVDGSRN